MLWFSVNFVAFPFVYMSLFQSLNELLERFRFHVLTPNKSRIAVARLTMEFLKSLAIKQGAVYHEIMACDVMA
jgi:hypothetical protein